MSPEPMTPELALEVSRLRMVREIRAHFELLDEFFGFATLLFLDCPSEAMAESIRLDLTADEASRIRFSWPGKGAA